ncbi:diguanylate cyclase with PAS/PAC and GAF sensors [Chondrocystis sp. NIES-4102]|nr:diguanylate cyclase with PAS/PAC and GAF sensors [Chondrocystis sp. NIES-4102]
MSKTSPSVTVLLLENDCEQRESIINLLHQINPQKYQWVHQQQLNSALNYLQDKYIDVLLINLDLTNKSNTNILQKIYAIKPYIVSIFITTSDQENTIIESQKLTTNYTTLTLENPCKKPHGQLLSPILIEKFIDGILQQQEIAQLQSQLEYTQDLFKTVVDTTSALMWIIDEKENYIFLNQAWLSFTGQSLETGLKENWRDRIHPDDLARCTKVYQSALNKCRGFEIEYRLKRFDNSYRLILNTAVRRYSSQGEFAGFLCFCLDITQRKKIEQKVIQQAKTDSLLADITKKIHSSLDLDIIIQTTAEAVKQFISAEKVSIMKIVASSSLNDNQLRRELILLFKSELVNFPLSCEIAATKALPNQELLSNYTQLALGKIIAFCNNANQITSTIINHDFVQLPNTNSNLLLVPIFAHQKLWGILSVEQDIIPKCWQVEEIKLLKQVAIQLGIAIKQSELYQDLAIANQELEKLAVIDSLTQIANRRKFDQHLEAEWKRSLREQSPLSLIICDIDCFKLYNDTYGHLAGDRCISQVAQAISKVVKRPADLVARYGGEEFALILPNTDIQGAEYLAKHIRLQVEALRIPHINSEVDLYITLSLGVASCIPNSNLSFSTLLSAADKGLYQAKELGRNRVVIFDLENL